MTSKYQEILNWPGFGKIFLPISASMMKAIATVLTDRGVGTVICLKCNTLNIVRDSLEAIEKAYDNSYMALGSGSTGAGMVRMCFEKQPRYLLVDEIEDVKQSDQGALLSLMQSGVLVETKIKGVRSMHLRFSVFATCNSVKKLRAPLLSRFMVFEMEGYNQEEFVKVAVEQLKKRGLEEGFAWFVAQEVWKLPEAQRNIRECVRLANLCQTEDDVIKMLGILK